MRFYPIVVVEQNGVQRGDVIECGSHLDVAEIVSALRDANSEPAQFRFVMAAPCSTWKQALRVAARMLERRPLAGQCGTCFSWQCQCDVPMTAVREATSCP